MSSSLGAPPNTLLRTPLHGDHVALGAKMVPFAGWDMPVSYPSGIVAEVKACRSAVGLFDVSHMGEVMVVGFEAQQFLSYATTNDVSKLSDGDAQYSLLLTDNGTVIDDIIVYRNNSNSFLIVVNASRRSEDFARFKELAHDFDVELADISDSKGLIAVQGPKAIDLIAEHAGATLIPSTRFKTGTAILFGIEVLISRTGYTGEDGVEILCEAPDALHIWQNFIEAGGTPCGLAARDVLRLEAGYPLYGHELDEEHNPFESGGGWVVKLKKGDFAGRDALIKSKSELEVSKLVGLKVLEPTNAIPRQGYTVHADSQGAQVGIITSGTLSPILGTGIALARVDAAHATIGTKLIIDIRGRDAVAEVVKPPFAGSLK